MNKETFEEPKQGTTLEQIDQTNPVTRGSTALVYKEETLEEAANKQWGNVHRTGVLGFIEGAKWQQDRMYSVEEVEKQKLQFAIGLLKVIEQPNGDLLGNKIKQQIIILEQKLSEL